MTVFTRGRRHFYSRTSTFLVACYANLYDAMSVRPSIAKWSVCFFGLFGCLIAPAHQHATRAAVYTALFFYLRWIERSTSALLHIRSYQLSNRSTQIRSTQISKQFYLKSNQLRSAQIMHQIVITASACLSRDRMSKNKTMTKCVRARYMIRWEKRSYVITVKLRSKGPGRKGNHFLFHFFIREFQSMASPMKSLGARFLCR